MQSIIQELRGEKVDIVPWSEDPARYVCNALSPAVVNKVVIDENSRSMEVTASLLYNDGFYSLEHIAFCEPDVLMKVGSLDEDEVSTLQKAARVALMEKLEEIPVESETEEVPDVAEDVQISSSAGAEVQDSRKDE